MNIEDQPSSSSSLAEFLAIGEPPVVFTQGSTAVHNPGHFYQVSAAAAKRLGRRAILLGEKGHLGGSSSEILSIPYAPYSQVFPFAAVNVHQGGSGTTGDALRSGKPMLVVPYGWDQPDNAARICRLGIGLDLSRANYSVDTAVHALRKLLEETSFTKTAAEVGRKVAAEDGLAAACNAIESVLN